MFFDLASEDEGKDINAISGGSKEEGEVKNVVGSHFVSFEYASPQGEEHTQNDRDHSAFASGIASSIAEGGVQDPMEGTATFATFSLQ